MKILIRRNRIIIIFAIIFIISLLFATSYIPVVNELKNVTLMNFSHVAEAKSKTVGLDISKDIEQAESMSSRSAIRSKIVDYNNGLVTFQELYDFSIDKYTDGFEVINNCKQAVRVVDSQVLLSVGTDELEISDVLVFTEDLSELKYEVENIGKAEVIVYSPIISDDLIIGYDILLFDLENVLQSIVQSEYEITLSDTNLFDSGIVETNYNKLYKHDSKYLYIHSISESKLLVITIEADSLFASISRISNTNILITILLTVSTIVIGNLFVMRFSRELLNKFSNRQAHYKKKVMYDSLTKIYSRAYLDQLLLDKTIVLKSTSIIMIDVDNFKKVNDEYGHLTGDKVLEFIGATLLKSFRDSDHVIRFGGDEFLIILQDTQLHIAKNIIDRFKHNIETHNTFEFPVSITYGISNISNFDELNKGINEADLIMLSNKH